MNEQETPQFAFSLKYQETSSNKYHKLIEDIKNKKEPKMFLIVL